MRGAARQTLSYEVENQLSGRPSNDGTDKRLADVCKRNTGSVLAGARKRAKAVEEGTEGFRPDTCMRCGTFG